MTRVTCRLTAKNRDQLRNPALDRQSSTRYLYLLQVYVWPLVHVSQMWTVWITVLVAFNRYVAICRPFQAIRVCTMRQARLQVLAGAVVIIVYNVPRFLEHRLDFYVEVCGDVIKGINSLIYLLPEAS